MKYIYFLNTSGLDIYQRIWGAFRAGWSEQKTGIYLSSGSSLDSSIVKDPDCLAVVLAVFSQESCDLANQVICPVVNFSNRLGAHPKAINFFPEEVEVIRLAMDHLVSKNFHRLGFIGFEGAGFSLDRENAFRAYADERNLEYKVFHYPNHWSDRHPIRFRQQERNQFLSWLQSCRPPVGVLAVNDNIGARFLRSLKESDPGLLPLVGLVGVDDDPFEKLWPDGDGVSLTTVRPSFEEVGRRSAVEIGKILRGGKIPPGTIIRVSGARLIERESTGGVGVDDAFVAGILRTAAQEIAGGLPPRVSELAARHHIPLRTLSQRVLSVTGRSLREIMMEERLKMAARLLTETTHSIAEIAQTCGFSKQGNLTESFQHLYGMTPREFRARNS